MTRSPEIEARLVHHCHDVLGCTVELRTRAEWFEETTPHLFGWTSPVRRDDGTPGLALSPELIDQMTEHLDDSDLHRFLTVIETYIDAHVAYLGDDPDQVKRDIENKLYTVAPSSLRLFSEVELRALNLLLGES